MEVFAILVLVIAAAACILSFRDAVEDPEVRECDCQSRDPHRCIREQCFDADSKDHTDDCRYCLDGCACECHYARKSEDSK